MYVCVEHLERFLTGEVNTDLKVFIQCVEKFLIDDTIWAAGQSMDIHIVSNAIEDLKNVRLIQQGTFLQHLLKTDRVNMQGATTIKITL